MQQPIHPHRWTNTTKLAVALFFAALVIFMAIRFQYLLSPLIAAGVLAYIFQPAVQFISRKLKISPHFAVIIVYILFVLIILGLLVWGGIALTGQISGLIAYLSRSISTWPSAITAFLANPIIIGKTTINISKIDLAQFNTQLVQYIQQLLSGLASGIANVGKSALSTVGWVFFSILISYFILFESEAGKNKLISSNLLGRGEDQEKISFGLDNIWNTYLRRQLLIFLITFIVYAILLALLNVNYFIGLALLAAFARFVPYLGPLITWIVYALVAGFASRPIFGMTPLAYAILVVVIAYLVDGFMDLFIFTKFMASALRMHPAAVMVATLVGLNLFGVIGVILAAPILATMLLLFRFARYKMIDEDPWAHLTFMPYEKTLPKWMLWLNNQFKKLSNVIKNWFGKIFHRKNKEKGDNNDNTP